jgi:hypothetical protein
MHIENVLLWFTRTYYLFVLVFALIYMPSFVAASIQQAMERKKLRSTLKDQNWDLKSTFCLLIRTNLPSSVNIVAVDWVSC